MIFCPVIYSNRCYPGLLTVKRTSPFFEMESYSALFTVNWQQSDVANWILPSLRRLGNIHASHTTVEEMRIFFGMSIHIACLGFPRIHFLGGQQNQIANNKPENQMEQVFQIEKLIEDCEWPWCDRGKKEEKNSLESQTTSGRSEERLPYPPETRTSEQTIPFTGCCRIWQFLPGKPYPTALKVLVFGSPEGLMLDWHMRSGAEAKLAKAKHTCDASVARWSSALQRRKTASRNTVTKEIKRRTMTGRKSEQIQTCAVRASWVLREQSKIQHIS